jgi:hypothetical protein
MRRLAIPFLLALSLAACSKAKNKEICQKAADHYGSCVKKTLGNEMYEMVKAKEKEGIEQCTGDDKTVAMYEKCLVETDCDKFQDCMMEYATTHGP